MQTLPPTVASFQILKEARNARQQWRNSGATAQSGGASSVKRSSSTTLQVAAISKPSARSRQNGSGLKWRRVLRNIGVASSSVRKPSSYSTTQDVRRPNAYAAPAGQRQSLGRDGS